MNYIVINTKVCPQTNNAIGRIYSNALSLSIYIYIYIYTHIHKHTYINITRAGGVHDAGRLLQQVEVLLGRGGPASAPPR